jgi:hypothetical protein
MIDLDSDTQLRKYIKQLGMCRQAAHPNGTPRFFGDKDLEDCIGIAGEIAFAKKFNLIIDTTIRPEGDGHVDFKTSIGTIDVKTARKAFNLLVKEWEMPKCADILVLAKFNDYLDIEFLGWETKEKMATMQIKDFGYGIRNYYRNRVLLKPIEELEKMLIV